ncbi:hypothetical protein AB0H57_15725 [Micromonospora sp. NPDC050686]|uniref:hypothetical protein n=1 Tax=Micromonospora sp. NPDC050686 TaxID=3154631 RepID=UPI0033D25B05
MPGPGAAPTVPEPQVTPTAPDPAVTPDGPETSEVTADSVGRDPVAPRSAGPAAPAQGFVFTAGRHRFVSCRADESPRSTVDRTSTAGPARFAAGGRSAPPGHSDPTGIAGPADAVGVGGDTHRGSVDGPGGQGDTGSGPWLPEFTSTVAPAASPPAVTGCSAEPGVRPD